MANSVSIEGTMVTLTVTPAIVVDQFGPIARVDMDNQEISAIAESIAVGVISMATESGVEPTQAERVNMEELVQCLLQLSAASDAGQDPGEVTAIVQDFLNSEPELANIAGELGAAIIANQ